VHELVNGVYSSGSLIDHNMHHVATTKAPIASSKFLSAMAKMPNANRAVPMSIIIGLPAVWPCELSVDLEHS
jgi:hypothetical protein